MQGGLIVSKQLLVAAAAIPIMIALVIAFPRFVPAGEQTPADSSTAQLRLQFVKEEMKRVSFGVTETLGARSSEVLIINNDGSAIYNVEAEGEKGSQKSFKVDMQTLKRLKAFFADTGFMQLPVERLDAKENATEFTRYTLQVNLGGSSKTVQWTDEASAKDFVPALLVEVQNRLEAIPKQ